MTINIYDPTLATDAELETQIDDLENRAPGLEIDPSDYESWNIAYEAWTAEEIYRVNPTAENLAYRLERLTALAAIAVLIETAPEPEEPLDEA